MTGAHRDRQRSIQVTCSSGLLPVIGTNPTILIMGSFPSRLSLEYSEYYGNPQNRFWTVMEALFGISATLPYLIRTEKLSASGIALWDVAGSCTRKGSADQSITDVIPNDIQGFLDTHKTIRCVALNGTSGAGKLFRRFFPDIQGKNENLIMYTLPSTSSANAASRLSDLINAWKILTEYSEKRT